MDFPPRQQGMDFPPRQQGMDFSAAPARCRGVSRGSKASWRQPRQQGVVAVKPRSLAGASG
jgi:hypothetical protein